jgi:1,2-dihydroxy-3-keto-5-methylthiopentene dioxygenase
MASCVSLVSCARRDLLSVPAGTPHWFDINSEPALGAIRLFGNNDSGCFKVNEDDVI